MRKIAFAATLLSLIGSAAWAQIPVPSPQNITRILNTTTKATLFCSTHPDNQ